MASKDPFAGLNPVLAARLRALLAASGGSIKIVSGYRSVQHQQDLYNAAVKKYGPQRASHFVARPGHSNHNKGMAVDLGGDLKLAAQLAPKFGLHFPMGWEPWHIEIAGAAPHVAEAYTPDPATGQLPAAPQDDPHDLSFQIQNFIHSMIGSPETP